MPEYPSALLGDEWPTLSPQRGEGKVRGHVVKKMRCHSNDEGLTQKQAQLKVYEVTLKCQVIFTLLNMTSQPQTSGKSPQKRG